MIFFAFLFLSCNRANQDASVKPKLNTSIGQTTTQPAESDAGKSGVAASESAPLSETSDTAGNGGRPFIPLKARFQPENTGDKDILKIIAAGSGENADQITFHYEWTKNGEPAGNGDSISGFKRGDKIAVKITPFAGKEQGQSRTLTTEIKKTTPRLTESAQKSFDGEVLLYQVRAVSPDGDPITYELIDAPQGMEIDKSSGLIKWVMPEKAVAAQSVKVKMSDNAGGELIYTLNISAK